VDVLAEYALSKCAPAPTRADLRQLGWMPKREDYRRYALVPTTQLIQRLQRKPRCRSIYFGTDSSNPASVHGGNGAEVIGLDWRFRWMKAGAPWHQTRCKATLILSCCSHPGGS